MNIAFFTQGMYLGKVPRNNTNMRTDQAWICALNADHYPIGYAPNKQYDIGIVIIPKEIHRERLAESQINLVSTLKQYCSKVLIMQESTQWDWQDESVNSMIWYYKELLNADAILCHNDIDIPYFEGLSANPAFILPTLMIEDTLELSNHKEDIVYVAGNWDIGYRGFDAWAIARDFELPMLGFKSGKFKRGEEISGVNYSQWIEWTQFMYELSKCKYGVQTYQASAGQFPLNCAYLGIPCIGYNDINTQKDLHPYTSVERGDLISARKLVYKLKNDKDFYNDCSIKAVELYNQLYKENIFLENWNKIVNTIYEK